MVGESHLQDQNLKSISDDQSNNFPQPHSKLLDENLRRELKSLRKKQEQHSKAVQKLRNTFRFKEGLIKEEQNKLQNLIKELNRLATP